LRRVLAGHQRFAVRVCALALLATAGFGAAASPHALGGAFQTSTEPTTTAPPPDPPPTTVPRPDPAPPPPAPRRPQPRPQPAPPQPPPAPPPPAASREPLRAEPVSPPPAASASRPPRTKAAPRRRSAAARTVERSATPKLARNPTVAALRLGEHIRQLEEAEIPGVLAPELVAVPVSSAATEPPSYRIDTSLVLLAALGLGTLLIVFSATPDAVLARGPLGSSVARARVEVALMGVAIIALAATIYLIVASS
jgi:hypothetical protein